MTTKPNERSGPDMKAFAATLVGQDIHTLTGRTNRVIAVRGDKAVVGTERSPAGREVDLNEVQSAADELFRAGDLLIEVDAVGYRSAFVGAVLALLPGAIAETRPRRIRLATGADRR